MTSIFELDQSIFTWINTVWSNSFFDLIMPWITHLADGNSVILWLFLISLLTGLQMVTSRKAGSDRKQHRTVMKAVGLSFLYAALIYGIVSGSYSALKHATHRPRPFLQQSVNLRIPPATASVLRHNGSFPSGHAANAFMIAVLFSELFRRKRYIFYGLAAMVALSRIYLGVHYPSDVVIGACLGLTFTRFMLSFGRLRKGVTIHG